jgi:hypothetical protein
MRFDPQDNPEYWDKVVRFFITAFQEHIRVEKELDNPLEVYKALRGLCSALDPDKRNSVQEVSTAIKTIIEVFTAQGVCSAERIAYSIEEDESASLQMLDMIAGYIPSRNQMKEPGQGDTHSVLARSCMLSAISHAHEDEMLSMSAMSTLFSALWRVQSEQRIHGERPLRTSLESEVSALLDAGMIVPVEALVAVRAASMRTTIQQCLSTYSAQTTAFAIKVLARSVAVNRCMDCDLGELYSLLAAGDLSIPVGVAARMVALSGVELEADTRVDRFVRLYEAFPHS